MIFEGNIEIVREVTPFLTIVLGGMVPAAAIGWMGSAAMKAIGRNPEAADKIQTVVILLTAFAEAIAIYSLVIALILKFV